AGVPRPDLPNWGEVHQQARGGQQLVALLDPLDDQAVPQIGGDENVGLVHRVAAEVADDPADADRHFLRIGNLATEQGHGVDGNHRGESRIEEYDCHGAKVYASDSEVFAPRG